MSQAPARSDSPAFGPMLRDWRRRRALSQLALASEAEISQRHLSFIESGRSRPSREMVLHLADCLAMPLRERNTLLLAAGFAPHFRERAAQDPEMKAALAAVATILRGHQPYPALAVDRHWTMVDANEAVAPLIGGVAPALVTPPFNVLRLTLHPDGLAGRIVNLREWRQHVLARLARQIEVTADATLIALRQEFAGYPLSPPAVAEPVSGPLTGPALAGVAIPFRLATDAGVLSFISTTTVFGTAVEISLSEVAIESFFPADEATAAALLGHRAES